MASALRTASTSQLSPIKWIRIPFQVPYLLGLSIQEHVVARRLTAKRFLESQPTSSPAARSGGEQSTSKRIQEAQSVAWQDYLFLLEHTPVYTEGRRKGAKEAIGDDEEGKRLEALGADYIVAQRGGLITFHGPGQIVGYPIIDIGRMNNLSTRCYVDLMQTVFHRLLNAHFNIPTIPPPDDHTGVWADPSHKILSIGIQVRQRITSHGFALNVCAQPLLTWFSHIVACGIRGKSMTSIERELALRVRNEEQARPDREAAPQNDARVQRATSPPTTTPSDDARGEMIEIEPGLVLGPESALSVAQVAPLVAAQFGQSYERAMEPATEHDIRFEADERNILRRVWFAGEEVKVLTGA